MDGELNQGTDPKIVHRDVIAMFPELDLTQIVSEFGHLSPEGLAGIIIDRMALIPRKKHGTLKRKADNESNDEVLSEYSGGSETAEQSGDLLVDKMLGEMLRSCKVELRNKRAVVDSSAWTGVKTLMIEHFPMVRADFVTKMVRHFEGAIVPTAIACFFVENSFGDKLQKIAPSFNQSFWYKMAVPIQCRGRRLKQAYVSEQLREHFKLYNELMCQYQSQYPELLAGLKLTQQARHILLERSEQEQLVECLVCFERVALRRMVCCTAPIESPSTGDASHQHIAQDSEGEVLLIELPSDSSRVQLLSDERETDSPVASHAFCRGCIRGQAQAATDEIPLADGGVGLKCMVPGCKNPILYSDIRILLKREVRRKLDERIVEENIGMASLQNLERCKLCNFAIEMEVDKTVNKVFDCLNCSAKFCRLCERRWDEDHFGISCDELDTKTKKDKKERELEKKLNEAVIRKCPRCGLAFMKDEGCNKMTCRCGMKQCYLCRQSNIDYSHFCRHLRDPKNPNWKCNLCNKKCLLFEDAKKLDSVVIDQIRLREEQEERRMAAGEGTSAATTEGQMPQQPQLDQRPTTSRATRANDATAHRRRMEALVERSRRLAANLWRQYPPPVDRRQNDVADGNYAPFNLYDGGEFQPPPLPVPFQPNVPPPPFAFPPNDPRFYPHHGGYNMMMYNNSQAPQQQPPLPYATNDHQRQHHHFQQPAQQQNPRMYPQQMFYNPPQPLPHHQYHHPTPLNRLPNVPQPSVAGAQVMVPPPAMVDVAFAGAEQAIQMFYNNAGVHNQQTHQQNGRPQ
ncbi:hypothetical protein niasHT_007674 [Heterodera trifolii]|uniref:RING-type domain-containing protein n=1 Tax=Heterodera trifolii TaxID=157864 RepID=A0ABD2LPV3_9BILA